LATKEYEFERWAVEQIKEARERIGAELSKVIIGQRDVIEHLLIAVLSGGHSLPALPRRCWSNRWPSCFT